MIVMFAFGFFAGLVAALTLAVVAAVREARVGESPDDDFDVPAWLSRPEPEDPERGPARLLTFRGRRQP